MRSFSVSLLTLCLVACSKPKSSPGAEAELVASGEAVSAALAASLMGSLQRVIAERGVTEAIPFCHDQAGPLTAQVAREHPEVRAVRRIGVRVRQEANQSDAMDLRALAQFAATKAKGGQPSPMLLRQAMPDGEERVRFYRPLLTAPLCLTCHGPADRLPPSVAETLRTLYPQDQAVGFEAGELRGAIVVEF